MKCVLALLLVLALAVPVYAEYGIDLDIGGDSDVIVSENNPKERRLVKGSFAIATPAGNDGPVVQTPWGSYNNQKVAEMTKLAIYHDALVSSGKDVSGVLSQMQEASKPCRFLSVGPERLAPFGIGCWASMRD